jgi:hypothetical protein
MIRFDSSSYSPYGCLAEGQLVICLEKVLPIMHIEVSGPLGSEASDHLEPMIAHALSTLNARFDRHVHLIQLQSFGSSIEDVKLITRYMRTINQPGYTPEFVAVVFDDMSRAARGELMLWHTGFHRAGVKFMSFSNTEGAREHILSKYRFPLRAGEQIKAELKVAG